MFIDALLNLVPYGAPLSCVGATGASFASNVIDVLGVGAGIAPPNIIGNSTLFGSDMGIGDNRPLIEALIGTAFVTAGTATLNMQFQGAPDTGLAGGYLPGTWQTYQETGTLTAAQLTAGQVLRMDFPAAFPANARPRFYRLLFTTPTGQQFSAGTVASAFITPDRDDQNNRFAVNNFVVS
jgi:hypothetical protein